MYEEDTTRFVAELSVRTLVPACQRYEGFAQEHVGTSAVNVVEEFQDLWCDERQSMEIIICRGQTQCAVLQLASTPNHQLCPGT